MRVSLFLADFAQADERGKVNAIGLGWSTIGTPLPPFGLVILVDIDWDETNQPHRVVGELLTADGQPVIVSGPMGGQPLRFEAQVEAGRPPGTLRGTAARWPFTVNMAGGMPLEPGRYEWRVSVEGFDDATATALFLVQHPIDPRAPSAP